MRGYGEYVGNHLHYCHGCHRTYVCAEELECDLSFVAMCEPCFIEGVIEREEEEQAHRITQARQAQSIRTVWPNPQQVGPERDGDDDPEES